MDDVLVLNAIVGPAELDSWIADSFRDMLGTCDGVPGMRGFSLRRLDAADGPKCLYVSVTSFIDRASFESWWRSDAFRAAHRDCLRFQQDPDRKLVSKRYDIENPTVTVSSDLDSTLRELLGPDFAELVTAASTFSSVAAWRPAAQPSVSACVV